jgi:hypothetical protein
MPSCASPDCCREMFTVLKKHVVVALTGWVNFLDVLRRMTMRGELMRGGGPVSAFGEGVPVSERAERASSGKGPQTSRWVRSPERFVPSTACAGRRQLATLRDSAPYAKLAPR